MAVAAPEYRWVSVSARTGRIIADLPGVRVPQVGQVLGGEVAASGTLPLGDRLPTRWEEAIDEAAACLVLLDGDDPVWGGPVTETERGETDEIALTLSSWEWFLRGFYVGDAAYTATQQTLIVADLLESFVQDGSHPLIVEADASTTLRSDSFEDADDKTALSALTACMNLDGGAEWTIGWRRLSDPERYVPVATIRDRIGISPGVGFEPAATFDLPGAVTTFRLTRSYATGDGANHITATSNPDPGSDQRPQSPPQVYADPLRPTVQRRFTPSTSITQVSTLVSHAVAELAIRRGGSRALALTAVADGAPRLGRTWSIGDDVGYDIAAPSVPSGLRGQARALGWTLDFPDDGPTTVTPILGVPS